MLRWSAPWEPNCSASASIWTDTAPAHAPSPAVLAPGVSVRDSQSMLVRWRSASDAHLDELLGSCASAALTYDPAGGSLGGPAPAGLKRRRWETALSSGSFDRAVHALKNWTVH